MTDDVAKMIEGHMRANLPGARNRLLEHGLALRADLGAHDLDVISLVMALEDEWDIEITDEEDENLRTVGDVHKLVALKLGEQVAA